MSEHAGESLGSMTALGNGAVMPPVAGSMVDLADSEVELLIPKDDVSDPELSIVIPAVNEELTIGDFVAWCHEGLAEAGVRGEILIVDSSTDRTAEMALAGGARVLRTPKRGLGRAYIDALPYIRGSLRRHGRRRLHLRLPPARLASSSAAGGQRVRHGLPVARVDRARGDAGAAPVLRHPGHDLDPQRLYGSRLHRHPLRDAGHHPRCAAAHGPLRPSHGSTPRRWSSSRSGWGCGPTEVPVTFLKDRDGRLSHHKRSGLVLTVPGRVDQPPRHVHLRRRVLRAQAGARHAHAWACCSHCR